LCCRLILFWLSRKTLDLVSPNIQSLRAITAFLATNIKKGLTLSVIDASHHLQNTRHGFSAISGSLVASGAEGNLLTIVKPLAGNLQETCRLFLRPGA